VDDTDILFETQIEDPHARSQMAYAGKILTRLYIVDTGVGSNLSAASIQDPR
jgi:hypothetical protein